MSSTLPSTLSSLATANLLQDQLQETPQLHPQPQPLHLDVDSTHTDTTAPPKQLRSFQTTSASFGRVVAWNNEAAQQMLVKNYVPAIRIFEMAIQKVKATYHLFAECYVKTFPTSSMNFSPTHSSILEGLFSWSLTHNQSPQDKEATAPLIYRHPIVLPVQEEYSQEDSALISMAIVFNLAVTHHICGNESLNRFHGNASISEMALLNLKAAGRYYDYTFRLARAYRCQQQQPQHKNDPPAMLLMAVLNNMGQLYHSMGHEKQSKECYSHLHRALLVIIVQQQPRPSDGGTAANSRTHAGPAATTSNDQVVRTSSSVPSPLPTSGENDVAPSNLSTALMSRQDVSVFMGNVTVGLKLVRYADLAPAA